MISCLLKTFLRASANATAISSFAKPIFLLTSARPFSDPQKDKLFESVKYTVDTRGLDYMHVIKENSQWDSVVTSSQKPIVVCFYAT